VSKFPPLTEELKPKPRLVRHQDAALSDDEVDANSRQIGERWGASTSLRTPVVPEQAAKLAPVVSIRGYIPDYLDKELAMRAAERRVTKTFLIMEALTKAGYHVEQDDLIQDRRRRGERL
jgi:hypothetical protein